MPTSRFVDYREVDPESFIDVPNATPEHGRGAWTREGIDFDYRYRLAPLARQRVGRHPDRSLSHWAVAAGTAAIQRRLVELECLDPVVDHGVFNRKTAEAVSRFQLMENDPDGGAELIVDGIVGRSDARALFTPLVDQAEVTHRIPNRLLLGQTVHESALDPGAVGYFIFYPDYRGVDRGFSQINSRAHPDITWQQAFDPVFALRYSGKRMRETYDTYRKAHPKRRKAVLWDAAVCAHNSPVNGKKWAQTGTAPTEQAASYVAAVKNARY